MKKYSSFIFNLLFLMLGLILLYLAFYKQDLSEIFSKVKQVDFRWMGAVLLVSSISHIVRALRWQMLTKPLQLPYSFASLFWAMMFGYLVNLAIPRMGEVSRCLILSRKQNNKHFATLLGTVVTERAVDVLSLIIVVSITFFIQIKLLYGFFNQYFFSPLDELTFNKQWLIILLVVIGVIILWVIFLFHRQLVKSKLGQKMSKFILGLWFGVLSISKINHIALFLLFTLILWVSYFLMTYLWFFSLPATSHLGIYDGVTLLAIGSIARLAPTQGGGLGAFQLLMSRGFLLLGIAEVFGAALAIVIHATQILFTLLVGGLAPLYFVFTKKL